jgi:hypothetical protein
MERKSERVGKRDAENDKQIKEQKDREKAHRQMER